MKAQQHASVPHLTTALTGPLQHIERHLLAHQAEIEAWFRAQWLKTPAPFYTSVDLRNAGFKLAPVDTNLFPAGFNNLNSAFLPLCIHAVQSAVERVCPTSQRILLVPENHTRNLFYLESLATLVKIISSAGFEVRVGSLLEDLEKPTDFDLPSGGVITLEPLKRTGGRVGVEGFDPCVVVLNNDLSDGHPDILVGIEQHIIPPLALGWSNRLKSGHFAHYRDVSEELSDLVGIDSWLISPLFRNCGEISFKKREGEDCLLKNAKALFTAIQLKYDEYGLTDKPFIVVKADAGTYGMGVMSVESPEELVELNRKQRNKMASAKGGQEVTQVILQEGVYTYETWEEAVAEPVIYMLDHFVVGGFYRVHKGRGARENLNAPGMHFEPLAFAEPCTTPDREEDPDANINRFYTYGVIARLAMLAAAREIHQHG